jgi:hypothetical protein
LPNSPTIKSLTLIASNLKKETTSFFETVAYNQESIQKKTLKTVHTVHCSRVDPLRNVNVLSAVRGEFKAGRWTEDFVLVSGKET